MIRHISQLYLVQIHSLAQILVIYCLRARDISSTSFHFRKHSLALSKIFWGKSNGLPCVWNIGASSRDGSYTAADIWSAINCVKATAKSNQNNIMLICMKTNVFAHLEINNLIKSFNYWSFCLINMLYIHT